MEMVKGLVRHLLTYGGGLLTTKGVTSSSEVEAAVGGIVALIGIVWSLVAKKKKPTVE